MTINKVEFAMGTLEEYIATSECPLADWIWGLSEWGQRPLVLAALAVAEPCLATWQQGVPEDPEWQSYFAHTRVAEDALNALRFWLRETNHLSESQMQSCLSPLRDKVCASESYAYEASGSAALCARRERCATAGHVIQLALEVATWSATRAVAGIPDETERQSVANTGPALETWTAVREYRASHPRTSEAMTRDLIRHTLLQR